MVLRGKLAEVMVKFAPQIYQKYVTLGAKGKLMLYVTLQKPFTDVCALRYYTISNWW